MENSIDYRENVIRECERKIYASGERINFIRRMTEQGPTEVLWRAWDSAISERAAIIEMSFAISREMGGFGRDRINQAIDCSGPVEVE